MENLDSDKEQLEQFKKWFQENGMSLVLGVVLGLGGVYGWRGWQSYQVSEAEKLSAELTVALQNLDTDEYELTASQAEKLAKDNNGTLNADMSMLILARARVEQGLLDKAIEPLKDIVANKKSVFNSIARLRLARIYLEKSSLNEAEKLIMDNTDKAYAHAFEELRGDLELARGKSAAARIAYLNSMTLASKGIDTQFLQMKLDDLPTAE
ncbi:MAG: tetratricopeptide repeat protein [Gammaproteobacteria bacterium]